MNLIFLRTVVSNKGQIGTNRKILYIQTGFFCDRENASRYSGTQWVEIFSNFLLFWDNGISLFFIHTAVYCLSKGNEGFFFVNPLAFQIEVQDQINVQALIKQSKIKVALQN